ncbi:MAG: hypothetical protein AB8G96_13410 [Phycisphaerales bacterium]
MLRRRNSAAMVAAMAALAPAVVALAANPGIDAHAGHDHGSKDSEERISLLGPEHVAAMADFRSNHPLTQLMLDDTGLVDRVYGASVAGGATAEAAADAAMIAAAEMLAVDLGDIVPTQVVEVMHDANGTPKFLLHRYEQVRDGVTVFRSRVQALVRNEPGFPVVLITSDAKPLGAFQPAPGLGNAEIPAAAIAHVEIDALDMAVTYSDVRGVIFAGHENAGEAPRSAVEFVSEISTPADPANYSKMRHVVDAATGATIFVESLVHHIDVSGTVSGLATDGIGAMPCEDEVTRPMPYARVDVGTTTVFADREGNFEASTVGGGDVTVNSQLRGRYFVVNNQAESDAEIAITAGDGEVVDIVHNESNSSDLRRAETNAYYEANMIRDWALALNPTYPTIGNQTNFDINVNINNNCNATYSGSAINFYTSGGGCNNTSFASVIYHEYGHHLVNTGGSGQGAYGEGMSDCVSALALDDPRLGLGFQGNCSSPLRNADNDCQFQETGCSSCGSAIHSCGRLISGAVWDMREALVSTQGDNALVYASTLTLNSILLHTGSGIDPSITIDILTLDDDDSNILNGTPNYEPINDAFGQHNMPGPALQLLAFEFPDGLPNSVSPDGGTMVRLTVTPVTGDPVPGTGRILVVDGSGAPVAVPLMPTGTPDEYMATFPSTTCGNLVDYWFETSATNGQVGRFPMDAPVARLSTISAFELAINFEDDFETNQGWTVQNAGGLEDGAWNRGVPAGGGDRGDPPADGDGSGRAFLTDNVAGNSDVDGGITRLISPVMDASNGNGVISYWRWYSNTFGASPNADVFEVEISDDGGGSWNELETVGPGGPEVDGGWFFKQFDLADVPGFELNDQFRIRFIASDLGDGSVVEAAVDGVALIDINCENMGVEGDIDGDGVVDFQDILALLSAWGECPGCAADLDDNGTVDFGDLLSLLSLLS